MPYLKEKDTEASADTGIQVTFEKPIGGKVFLKRINVHSTKAIDFGKWRGWLYLDDAQHDFPREVLFHKIVPSVDEGAPLWEGHIDWPHNWVLYLAGKTQLVTSTTYWSVEYEVEPEPKKRWGD